MEILAAVDGKDVDVIDRRLGGIAECRAQVPRLLERRHAAERRFRLDEHHRSAALGGLEGGSHAADATADDQNRMAGCDGCRHGVSESKGNCEM